MHVRIVAVAMLLWGWIAVAQVRETVDVSLTNVDVVVTDGRGRPVRGLTREEFEILEGGRRREITNFSEVTVPDGERRKVPLKILIPIDRLKLEREGSEMTGGFTVYLSSGNERGEATKVNRQSHQIRWPLEAVDNLKGKNMTFNVEVSVTPGVTQISVGVLDNRSEQTGFERLSL